MWRKDTWEGHNKDEFYSITDSLLTFFELPNLSGAYGIYPKLKSPVRQFRPYRRFICHSELLHYFSKWTGLI
jgi:hypothetical protein